MSPLQTVVVLALGAACGWAARIFEETAIRERATERLRPFGPAKGHCRRLDPPLYDWTKDNADD